MKTIGKILPKKIKFKLIRIYVRYKLMKAYYFDLKKFENSAVLHPEQNEYENLRSKLTYHYHALEKGMSHPKRRLGFGKSNLSELYTVIVNYNKLGYPTDDLRYKTAISAINEYIKIHDENNYDVTEVRERFQIFLGDGKEKLAGSIFHSQSKHFKDEKLSFKELAKNRSSVRSFSSEPVDINLINLALKLSLKTPSVCNRQPWKAYVIKNNEIIKGVLDNQRGFRGYENYVDTLLTITVDNKYFLGIHERNQGNIDGGMFAMSILYSLEYYGLAACPLNAALQIDNETEIRKLTDIPNNENFIMFIAVGNFPSNYLTPVSIRDDLNSIVQYLE